MSGTHGKFRVVPRSAIADYERLKSDVRNDNGEAPLRTTVEYLWQNYGAPSQATIDTFLTEADRQDTLRSTIPAERADRARRQFLEAWLDSCQPPSTAARLRQAIELGICFIMRRSRQYARALVHLVRTRS